MTALFILAVIVLFLLLDVGVRKAEGWRAEPAPADLPAFTADVRAGNGRFNGRSHVWASLGEDGEVRLGVDDFARAALGKADIFELPAPGSKVEKGAPLLTAVRGGRRLEFASPLSGTVIAANDDHQGGGDRSWLLSLSPSRLGGEIRGLLICEEAAAWLRREIARFREFLFAGLAPATGTATLPDGGTPVEGALTLMPEGAWKAFESEFLTGQS